MTFEELFGRLCHIDQEAVSLLEDTGFYSEDGLDGSVRPLPDILEDAFLREQAEELLETFEGFHEELSYLRRPARGGDTPWNSSLTDATDTVIRRERSAVSAAGTAWKQKSVTGMAAAAG